MDFLDLVLDQVLQPYFFYSVILSVISLISVVLLVNISGTLGSRWKSIAYLVPFVLPLVIICLFPPVTSIAVNSPSGIPPLASVTSLQPHVQLLSPHPTFPIWASPGAMIVNALPIDYIPSITGILCLIGLVMCFAWIVFSVSVGSQLARRILRVVELGPEDYPGLQASVAELAKIMGVVRPRIGLVEDLRPNAFICGRNKRPMIVFSLGLIKMLDDDELRAVATHELVHIKHRDAQFRTVASALAWLSFFNPLAFVAMRMARRERERMADDAASAVLGDKAALVEAIKKVSSALASPGSKPLRGSGLGFLLVSSLSERISLLSTHPSVTDRVRNIKKGSRKRPTTSSLAVCLVLSLLVIVAAGSLTISLGQLREEMIKGNLDLMRIAPEDNGFHLNVPPRDIIRADQAPHDLDFASPSPSNPHNVLRSSLISAVVPMHRY